MYRRSLILARNFDVKSMVIEENKATHPLRFFD